MVPGNTLLESAWSLDVSDEVFHKVKEAIRRACTSNCCLELNYTTRAIGPDDFPAPKESPGRICRSDSCFRAVGEDYESVRPEELRDCVAIINEVVVVRL